MPTRSRGRSWQVFAASAALLACALACEPAYDPCFKPDSVVDGLRLLAVRSDPPEALVDLDAGIVPELQIRALIGNPSLANATVQLIAKVCIPTIDLLCPDGSPTFTGPLSHPGAGEGTMALDVPASLIAAARDADPLRGYGGTRVQLDLQALVGSGSAQASKTLLFSDAATTSAPNQPIEIGEVDLSVASKPMSTVLPGTVVDLLVPDTYGLRPQLLPLPDGGSPLEAYSTVDLDGNAVQLREQVTYNFYAESDLLFGDLPIDGDTPVGVYIQGADVADEPAPGAPVPADGLVRATPMVGGSARLWVVGRDSRGAVAWEWFDAQIEDNRVCYTSEGVLCTGGMNCCVDPFIGCR